MFYPPKRKVESRAQNAELAVALYWRATPEFADAWI